MATNRQETQIILQQEDGENGTKMLVYFCPACETYHSVTTEGQNSSGAGPWEWNEDKKSPSISPSVLHRRPREGGTYVCHHYIKSGRILYLTDCTHQFKGRTVDMEQV